MNATDIEIREIERRLEEAERKSLHDYKRGKSPAPVLYRAGGYLKSLSGKDGNGGPMVFVASEESADRRGDIIMTSGWNLENFAKNPVIMYCHDYSCAPIARAPKVWVDGKQLLNAVEWDNEDPLAASIRGKYERGFQRAESVGFRALEYEETKTGLVFKQQELLEISMVPIPMHPLALKKALETRHFAIVMDGLRQTIAPEENATLKDYHEEHIAAAADHAMNATEMTQAAHDEMQAAMKGGQSKKQMMDMEMRGHMYAAKGHMGDAMNEMMAASAEMDAAMNGEEDTSGDATQMGKTKGGEPNGAKEGSEKGQKGGEERQIAPPAQMKDAPPVHDGARQEQEDGAAVLAALRYSTKLVLKEG